MPEALTSFDPHRDGSGVEYKGTDKTVPCKFGVQRMQELYT